MLASWIARCEERPKLALAVCALLLAAQVGPWWYSSVDSASYLSMARSLAQGTGPTNLGSRLLWYSPGYPALISPLFLVGDRPLFWLSAFQWFGAVGLMLGVYQWCRRVAPDAAVWIACLTVVNHGLWLHFRRPLSEIAFLCLLVWTVNLLSSVWQASKWAFAFRLSTACLLVALVCLVRPVGIMLAPGLAVSAFFDALRGRATWLRAVVASLAVAAAAALPVAWFVSHERRIAAELDGRTYVDEFRDAARTPLASCSSGVQMCVSDIGRVCIPGLFKSHGVLGDWTNVNMLIHLPFFALICYGWRAWTRGQGDPLAWYMPFYFLLIAAHAVDTGARLMLPLLPALLVCLWYALRGLGRQRQLVFAVCLALQASVAGGYWLIYDLPRARNFDQCWADVDRLAAVIHADPGPVLALELPDDLHLMLELALDRSVSRGHASAAEPARWLVAPCDSSLAAEVLPSRAMQPCCRTAHLVCHRLTEKR
ncbi:MAG TPA: hypothetical protein VGX78_11825 [Pirellulales bacterium]|nr:hypothetical protein [Pirellulales bacterium]